MTVLEHRWTYFVANWANMVWAAQLLLARTSGSTSAALGTAKFLDNWRLGQTVRPSTVFNSHVVIVVVITS